MAYQGGMGLGNPLGQPVNMGPIPIRMMLGLVLLLILGLAGLALGLALDEARVIAYVGATLCLGAVALLIQRQNQKGTLQLHERGVAFTRKGKRLELPFAGVKVLTLKEEQALNNGHQVGFERRLRMEGPEGKIAFKHTSRHGQADGVGSFVRALFDGMAEAQAAKFATGGSLSGKGWTLKAEGLLGKQGLVPLGQVSRVGLFEAKVSCWARHEDEPFLSVAASSPNALVLLRYVGARVVASGTPAKGLGPVLFSKQYNRWVVGLVVLLVIPLLKAISLLIWKAGDAPTTWLTTGGAVALGLTLGALLWQYRFECREEGLTLRNLWGSMEVRYADIDRLRFQSTRQYVNGIYGGTRLELTAFLPNGKKLQLQKNCKGMDDDLENLREHISSLIATRLQACLERGEAVAWGSCVQLHRESLTFRPDQFIGRGEPTTLPYSALAAPVIANGTLSLLDQGTGKKLCSFPCADDNFYPGYRVFMGRWKR